MKLVLILIVTNLILLYGLKGNAGRPYVINYHKDDYGASSKNWSVAVNSEGLVYFGNHYGLLETDGQAWNLYKLPHGGIVRSVAIDQNDRIYTGSFEEFGYWEADKTGLLHYTSLSNNLDDFTFHNEQIWKIIVKDQNVYFQAFNNVFVFNGEEVSHVNNCPNIIFLLEAGDKLIVQEVDNGLLELKDDGFVKIKNSEKLLGAEIKVIMPYKDSSFVLGSGTRGLYLWENNEFHIWKCDAQKVLAGKQINHGVYQNGKYYIGTITDGVYVVNEQGNIVTHLNTDNYLRNNTILGMCFGNDDNLWLNHDKGLSLVNFNFPYQPVISSNNQLGAIHAAVLYNGNLYLGTNQGLYYTEVNDSLNMKLTDFRIMEGSQGQVWDLKVFDDQLICGHNNGTYIVEGNQITKISNVSGGYCMKKISEDLLIQSTYTNLVIYQRNSQGKWDFHQEVDGFIEPIRYVENDFRGNIWASHSRKGIYKLQLGNNYSTVISSEYYGKNEGFALESKTHVFKLDNRIVFTSGEKIFTYDDLEDSVIVFEELNRQLGNFSKAEKIVKAHENDYWFITSSKAGLFEITGNNARFKMEINLNRKGYHFVEENPNIYAIYGNQYLVCLEDGFMILNPDLVADSSGLNPVAIRKVSDNRSGSRLLLETDEVPQIPYNNNSVSISYSPLIFPGDGTRFSVKLEGLNRKWSDYTYSSSITYSRLPWGEYTFRVNGLTEFGNSIPPGHYAFEILPPWYATSYAIAGYLFIAMLFFIIFPLMINRYFKKEQETYKKKQEKLFRGKQKEQQYLAEQKIIRLQNQQLQKELENKTRELANNTMIIIKRNETLTEVKKEIDKQKEILGSRLPNKNYDKLIGLIDKNLSSEEEFKVFEENFDLAHNNFFKRLKKEYPLLTPGDMRLCAFLRLNLTSKEIAPLMNISTRGVEIHRYRLRKKLELSTDDNLVEFILQF